DEQSTILFADGTMEIGSVSRDGAGVPDTMGSLIEVTMKSVLQQEGPDAQGAELGDVSQEELRDFARRHRRTLLAIATQNIAEMPAVDEIFREGLRRNEQGELVFANPLNIRLKGSLDVYAALALGCPALRLQHATRAELTMAERIAQGSSNYIDH